MGCEEKGTYSRKFVASIANEHTSLTNSSISNSHTLDELCSTHFFWGSFPYKRSQKKFTREVSNKKV